MDKRESDAREVLARILTHPPSMSAELNQRVDAAMSAFHGNGAHEFLSEIHKRTPTGAWIAVQHCQDGSWSVAEQSLPWLPGGEIAVPRDTLPAANLEAVKEACAKVADDMASTSHVYERRFAAYRIGDAIRSLDLSALSCAGEG